jgi:hypothetical protein
MIKKNAPSRFFFILSVLTFIIGSAMAEEPKYKIVKKSGDFEIRKYEPYIIAETVVDTGDIDAASSEGFRRLAGYIFGGNQPKQKMEMTAPVTSQRSEKIEMTAPVTSAKRDGSTVITFMMPSSYTLESLPVPNDNRVILRKVPARTLASISFSGRWTDENFAEHLKELEDWVENEHLVTLGEPILARYNAPFVPSFLRRNEILIELKQTE